MSGTPNLSPPPRHEADDYMNVYGHDHQHVKKHHPKRKWRKSYNSREGSGGSKPPQRSLRSGPQTGASHGSDCELCAADNSDGDEESSSNAPLLMGSGRPSVRNHLHSSREVANLEELQAQTSSAVGSDVDEPDSLAIDALRSLTFKAPTRSNSQGLRRVSTALTSTLNLFRTNPTVSFNDVPPHNVSKKAEKALRKSSAHSKSLVSRDINHRRPTIKDSRDDAQALETPATITLRKASNIGILSLITTSMSASLAHEPDHKRAADAPVSELLAFYSSPTLEKRPTLTNLPTSESDERLGSLKGQPTFAFEESPPSRTRSKSVSQFSNIHNARRSSMPAEAAITFADVHVAPGSFSVVPKSRTEAIVPAEVSRRISTVQFRSRNSVHEVIWREDETTSDSSLTASSRASQHAGRSLQSSPSPQICSSPTQKSAIDTKETKSLPTIVPKSVLAFSKLPENLVRWTWGTSSASMEGTPNAVVKGDSSGQAAGGTSGAADNRGDPLGQVLVNGTSDQAPINLQQSSDQQASRSQPQKPLFSKLSTVQSFPPLQPRRSSAEWRKAPLVDLNDPLAGRFTQTQVHKTTNSAGLKKGGASGILKGKNSGTLQLRDTDGNSRRSSVPPGIARLGSAGSMGSGIGANSRKRVVSRRKLSSWSEVHNEAWLSASRL